MHTNDKQNIDNFWVVGINYKKTDASVRGLFAISGDQYDRILTAASQNAANDFFILSTCNRTEIYGFAGTQREVTDLLCSTASGDRAMFDRISYAKNGTSAVEHLFHVASGLDSQILGDYEILGQIKNAVKSAKKYDLIGSVFERMLNSVLQASKAIKTHTGLSGGTVSTSFAAIQYIREYFEGASVTPDMKCPSTKQMMVPATDTTKGTTKVEDKKIVLLGTGKIGHATCRNLVDYLDTHNITLINRTAEKAASIANELGLKYAPVENMEAELQSADIILVSTNSATPVIFKEHLEGMGDKLVIDLSVPCNVDIAAQSLPGITFVDVDMLSRIKDETLQRRVAEVPKAVAIIEEHMAEFKQWYNMRRHVPVLKEVKSKLKAIYIDPVLLGSSDQLCPIYLKGQDEKIQKVINTLALKIRSENTPGCNYIQAINEFIA